MQHLNFLEYSPLADEVSRVWGTHAIASYMVFKVVFKYLEITPKRFLKVFVATTRLSLQAYKFLYIHATRMRLRLVFFIMFTSLSHDHPRAIDPRWHSQIR